MIKRADFAVLQLGIAATLLGVGIARLAYTPLLPELVEQGWFSQDQAVYLGAANLLGYLAGAVSAHALSQRLGSPLILRISFVAIVLSFALCVLPGWFSWFFIWRFIAGVTGAWLMVLAPSLALSLTPLERRGNVGVLVFTGIGIGICISALVVPLFIEQGLSFSWVGLALVCAGVAWAGHTGLQSILNSAGDITSVTQQPDSADDNSAHEWRGVGAAVWLAIVAYGLAAVGYIPHSLFWVDYLAREQNLGVHIASFQWLVFGFGACSGPLLTAWLSQRYGVKNALAMAYLIQTVGTAVMLFSVDALSRSVSSFFVGAMVPGIVGLTSALLAHWLGAARHKALWGMATAMFAVFQAAAGYGMSALYVTLGSYYPLFFAAAIIMAVGCLLIALAGAFYKRSVTGDPL